MWLLYCAWRYGGHDPYKLYNQGEATPPCPQPWRLRYLTYAMAAFARDDDLKVHSMHPDQQQKSGTTAGGTTMRMPGGREGVKK